MIEAVRTLSLRTAMLRRLPVWPVAIWLLLVVTALVARPPLSSVESPPLSMAWRMWVSGSFLPSAVDPQDIQAPLPYWLIHLGWAVFGVSEDWARLVMPLTALGALLLIGPVARLIWPGRPEAGPLAAVILAGSGGFALFSSLILLDTALPLFILLGLAGMALAWRGRPVGWALFGAALGIGFLANGAIVLLHLLAPPLLAPLWMDKARPPRPIAWYGGLLLAVLLGAAIGLVWVLPAINASGPGQLGAILLKPMLLKPHGNGSWYGPLLTAPLVLYPWLWWRTLWRAARRQFRPKRDEGLRLCSLAAAASLCVALSTGDRQFQDLLPVLPALALIAGRLLAAPGGKPKDFHAVIPGFLALLVGLVFFLLNIVPVAHLDAVWREFIDDDSLPIWLGGISQVSGLILLGGGYLLAQMSPRELFSRTVQVALLPVLLVTTINLEFLFSLGRFFDLKPVAREIQTLQSRGVPVTIFGSYQGEFDFAGRLEKPLTVLHEPDAVLDWVEDNKSGVVVSYFKGSVLRLPGQPLQLAIVGNSWAAMWSADTIRATKGAVLKMRF